MNGRWILPIVMAAAASIQVSCSGPARPTPPTPVIGGDYGPVTDVDVIDLKLIRYFTADKQYHDPDFEWTFTGTEFVVKKGKEPIPADLLEKLLPPKTTADEVRGKWKLGGKRLNLTDIKSGDKAGDKDVSLPIYKVAPTVTVVQVGESQYVFSVGR